MRALKIGLYQLDELEPDARAKAIKEISEIYDPFDFYAGEFDKSISGFVEAMGLRFNRFTSCRWAIDPDISFNVVFSEDYELHELKLQGRRLQKWLYNNFWGKITQGKYYGKTVKDDSNSLKFRHVFRHSNIITDKNACVFSGTVYDTYFIQPVINFIETRYPCESLFTEDVVGYAITQGLLAFKEDMDYYRSDEGVSEYTDANDFEFLKDGTFYKDNLR